MALSVAPKKRLTNQLEFLIKKFPFILRHKNAARFLRPVDHIAYDIPDYPIVVKYPIDFYCIYDRLRMNFYVSSKNCLDDITQIFNNCYIYNSPEECIIYDALILQNYINIKLNDMPEVEIPISRPNKRKLHTQHVPIKRKRNKIKSEPKPEIKLQDSPVEDIVKKESPQPSLSSEEATAPPDIDNCLEIVEKLLSPTYSPINFLFIDNNYNDKNNYNIDLNYLKININKGSYANKHDFVKDMYLMINNVAIKHTANSEFVKKCWKFQEEFEKLFMNLFGESCESYLNQSIHVLSKILKRQKDLENIISAVGQRITNSRQQLDSVVSLVEKQKEIEKSHSKGYIA